MSAAPAIAAAVRTYFRALLTGDRGLLASVSIPHPDLGVLVPTQPARPGVANMLNDVARLDVSSTPLPGTRHVAQACLGGVVHVLMVRDTDAGPRLDLRYPINSLAPDDERRSAARAFYRAMLLGDLRTLRELAFDARGVELLAENRPPAGEHAQLEHVAAALGFAELVVGEPFVVPDGVQFVSPRHAEMGITVLSGLTVSGEVPFLLRQRNGAWTVVPFHFIQAAALSRGASMA